MSTSSTQDAADVCSVGGGGAKSTERKSKLKAKNWKLSEERRRRAEEEAKVDRKEAHKKGEVKGRQQEQAVDRPEDNGLVTNNNGDIHPSRRSRLSVA
jgi:nucleolar protein 6